MPELPEVETVAKTLTELVSGKTISHVKVLLPRIIQYPLDVDAFCAELVGQTIEKVERRGKFLRILLDDLVLVSHLRMEGRYGLFQATDPVEKHSHVLFTFTDGSELRYKDVRQFGTMHLYKRGEELSSPPLNKLGVEPFSKEFTAKLLSEKLKGRSSKIKPLLLNQELVVGLGNIYVDESLFLARIHPERTPDTLSKVDWKRLHESIVSTLSAAVAAGGSSIKSYVNGQGEMGMFQQQLNVYGKKNEPCPHCKKPIVKTVVGGRGTHYCKKCQPMKHAK